LALRVPGASTPEDFWVATRAAAPAFSTRPQGTGAFLDEALVTDYDAAAFGGAETDAAAIDPQQRLFAAVALEALEATPLGGRRVGVFAAAGDNEYALRWIGRPERVGRGSLLGALHNMVAARVAQRFGFTGPALTVNAACASSLVAVHLARQSL